MNFNSKIPLTQEAYNIIKKLIIDLHFRPGEIILTKQLADQLGISRTPVREAMVKLTQEGLMQQTDSRKFKVSEVTRSSIEELYDLRACFEALALDKVFHKINDDDIKILQQNVIQMEEALNSKLYDEFFKLDMEFHQYFMKKYNNCILESFMKQIIDTQQRIRYITKFIDNRLEDTIDEHQKILNCFIKRDLEGAKKTINNHLDQVRSGMVELLEDKDAKYIMQVQLMNFK